MSRSIYTFAAVLFALAAFAIPTFADEEAPAWLKQADKILAKKARPLP